MKCSPSSFPDIACDAFKRNIVYFVTAEAVILAFALLLAVLRLPPRGLRSSRCG